MAAWKGLIHHYKSRLDLPQNVEPVTLLEGNTPLIPAPRLAEALAQNLTKFDLYLKYEGLNPTGSFKDRGMTAAVTQAIADRSTAVVCASTGNTAAAAAAYAARGGLACHVIVPAGNVALGKLAGALAYGAKIVAIHGSFDDGLRMVREAADRAPLTLVNSVNPARMEGQKTAAWEVTDQLGKAPDWLALPVGNAGNISAYWLGFTQQPGPRPRLLGVQAAGASPLVTGRPCPHPETKATAIRIGNPARGDQAMQALKESNGHILAATDEEIFASYHQVAQLEGVFCEPSSAAGLAGLAKQIQTDPQAFEGKTVVAVLTGHGLKDPAPILDHAPTLVECPADTDHYLSLLEKP